MCSSPPLVVISTALPITDTLRYGRSISKIVSATFGLRFRFLIQARERAPFTITVSPSTSTQTIVLRGVPSRPTVATATKFLSSKSFRFGNTSVTIVEVDDDGTRRLVLQNCLRHLEEALTANEGSP